MNARLRQGGPVLRAVLAVTLGLIVGAGAVVWARSELVRLRYRQAQLARVQAALDRELEKLRIEVAALTAPEQLESQARELGLHFPEPGQVVQVSGSGAASGARP